MIRCSANTRNNPLPQISDQVQNQVRDRIRILIPARPYLVFRKEVDAIVNPRFLLAKTAHRSGDKRFMNGCNVGQ